MITIYFKTEICIFILKCPFIADESGHIICEKVNCERLGKIFKLIDNQIISKILDTKHWLDQDIQNLYNKDKN